MPDVAIIDTHVHFWDQAQQPHPWLAKAGVLNRAFLPRDYRQACAPVTVERIVFVEAAVAADHSLAEARWVATLAQRDEPRIAGIVAAALLEQGDAVRPHLEALKAIPLVRGVRRLLQDEADNRFCLSPGFVRGTGLLAEFGFSFDICIRHWQLAAVVELVRRCPQVSFMLDHVAKPGIKDQLFEPWRQQIRELASLPNVCCKVSGMVTEADVACWTPADLRPYIDHVIECFGFERVAYGSDWPVATLAARYPQWVQALDEAVAGASQAEKRKLFRDNGARFYRLG